jgi:adenine-specific DNA-methyltransferase
VRYDYPLVQGKPSIPKRGAGGRFASPFATRSNSQVELILSRIINESLERGWSCLWSYSNTGAAAMYKVLEQISMRTRHIDIFCMDHTYKAQGRHRAKTVKEYAFLIRPK